nr:hypothetical protein Iba_chr03aCG3460 [Ipomoea batatas]
MSSQSSTANQEEMRAKKGKASMTETKLPKPKEEGNEGSSALGYQARMEWTEEIMKKAAKTPLSLKDLSTLNICRTRRVKKEARATKKKIPKLPKVEMEPPPPSSSSTTPQPNTPLEPSEKDPTLAQSSSLPVAPSRFTKVTDWKTMQSFQYELHLEHETFLEQREARHYELLEEMRSRRKPPRERRGLHRSGGVQGEIHVVAGGNPHVKYVEVRAELKNGVRVDEEKEEKEYKLKEIEVRGDEINVSCNIFCV